MKRRAAARPARWLGGLVLLAACSSESGEESRDDAARRPLDFEAHVAELRRDRLPEGFQLAIEPPFVVIGDMPQAELQRWTEETVRWAVHLLRQDYFPEDLDQIVDVWLFKDGPSYRKHVWEIFGEKPSTHFGYYSPKHSALLMNISTGGGTLVHEIVHPYVSANFPSCPTWLNEGLGSLYEASHAEQGRIVGLVNWRLAGLQKCLEEGRLPSFPALFALSDDEFYGATVGDPYAQARYLCLWLEQQGLMREYWARVRAAIDRDPTGERTLLEVLQVEDFEEFRPRWEAWVLSLGPE